MGEIQPTRYLLYRCVGASSLFHFFVAYPAFQSSTAHRYTDRNLPSCARVCARAAYPTFQTSSRATAHKKIDLNLPSCVQLRIGSAVNHSCTLLCFDFAIRLGSKRSPFLPSQYLSRRSPLLLIYSPISHPEHVIQLEAGPHLIHGNLASCLFPSLLRLVCFHGNTPFPQITCASQDGSLTGVCSTPAGIAQQWSLVRLSSTEGYLTPDVFDRYPLPTGII